MADEMNPWQGTIDWLVLLFKHVAGFGTPVEGMKASAILFAVTFASNFVGLVFTIVLDILFAFLFFVHFLRWGVEQARS